MSNKNNSFAEIFTWLGWLEGKMEHVPIDEIMSA
jgi:hypothetical protein